MDAFFPSVTALLLTNLTHAFQGERHGGREGGREGERKREGEGIGREGES